MISGRMLSEMFLVIQEMMTDLRETKALLEKAPIGFRGPLNGASMQTDFLRYGNASNLWDAHAIIKRAKVQAQMIVQAHYGHEPEPWGHEPRNSPTAGPTIDEWPKRYR